MLGCHAGGQQNQLTQTIFSNLITFFSPLEKKAGNATTLLGKGCNDTDKLSTPVYYFFLLYIKDRKNKDLFLNSPALIKQFFFFNVPNRY